MFQGRPHIKEKLETYIETLLKIIIMKYVSGVSSTDFLVALIVAGMTCVISALLYDIATRFRYW